ncbi:STAS domain-containing protein, partial [Haliangium sp. UPWRP_2]|uniref:STAS domain-containing protein n=1 Tax=Haliangium sp. UPWRP_2 TaxID=1931276 RepID=UPI001E43C8A0
WSAGEPMTQAAPEALPARLLVEVVERLTSQLCSRRGTAFQHRGPVATARLLQRLGAALLQDLATGTIDRLSADLRDAVAELSKNPISFRDLRLLATGLRSALLEASAAYPQLDAVALRRIEDWFMELALQCGLLLITWREEVIGRLASQLEGKIAEQRALSIPIAPVYEGVLVVPLVGVLDSFRAQLLLEKLLSEITRSHAQLALLDISGVPSFDAEVASHLIQVTQACRLLGTELVLVGLSPEIAKVLVGLRADLQELRTLRNLQQGVGYALSRLAPEDVAARPARTHRPAVGPNRQSP